MVAFRKQEFQDACQVTVPPISLFVVVVTNIVLLALMQMPDTFSFHLILLTQERTLCPNTIYTTTPLIHTFTKFKFFSSLILSN
jgi:hypothetical protein